MFSFVKSWFIFSAVHSHTILAKIQAEISSIHYGGVSANGPQIEVHVNRQRCKSCNSKPGQHKDVCQHNKLQKKKRKPKPVVCQNLTDTPLQKREQKCDTRISDWICLYLPLVKLCFWSDDQLIIWSK